LGYTFFADAQVKQAVLLEAFDNGADHQSAGEMRSLITLQALANNALQLGTASQLRDREDSTAVSITF